MENRRHAEQASPYPFMVKTCLLKFGGTLGVIPKAGNAQVPKPDKWLEDHSRSSDLPPDTFTTWFYNSLSREKIIVDGTQLKLSGQAIFSKRRNK